jgi:hypothetical protein
LNAIADHFDDTENESSDFVYVGDYRGDKLRIPLRFLELRGTDLLVVDWPTITHEVVVRTFLSEFVHAFGNADEIEQNYGSFTAHMHGYPPKAADASFGPMGETPNHPDPPSSGQNWVMFLLRLVSLRAGQVSRMQLHGGRHILEWYASCVSRWIQMQETGTIE